MFLFVILSFLASFFCKDGQQRLNYVLLTDSYPGLWEIPLVPWQCDQAGVLGTMVDECQDTGDEENVYNLIMRNFDIHYQNNKQPFPVFGHSSWFDNAPYRKTGETIFICNFNNG